MFDLDRFKEAQERDYAQALAQLRAGRKRTHWIWYVFPQVEGLGHSPTARYYALGGLDEARAYLADPLLASRLEECCEALLALDGDDPAAVLGFPDDLKVRSSLTLFEAAAGDAARARPFSRVLDRYYRGERDPLTLGIIGRDVPEAAGGAFQGHGG